MYGDFSETVTATEIAELGTILDTLTGITCDALQGADTVAGVTVELVAAGIRFLQVVCDIDNIKYSPDRNSRGKLNNWEEGLCFEKIQDSRFKIQNIYLHYT